MSLVAQLAVLLCLLAPGCRQQAERPAAVSSDTLELSAARPVLELAVPPADSPGTREILALSVVRIDNPARVGFGIGASLETRDQAGTRAVPLGLVSPFPADSPGTYLLRASEAWIMLGSSAPASVRLRLELVSSGPQGLPAGLRVRLGGIAWQRAPGRKP